MMSEEEKAKCAELIAAEITIPESGRKKVGGLLDSAIENFAIEFNLLLNGADSEKDKALYVSAFNKIKQCFCDVYNGRIKESCYGPIDGVMVLKHKIGDDWVIDPSV